MFTASEILDLAIQIEVNGEDFYRNALGKVIRAELKALLAWLADEEARHRDTFQALKETLCGEAGGCDPIARATGDALRSAMGRHAFSLDELEINVITDEKELLQAAVGFEEDSALFYEFIASLINDPRGLSAIREIREQEIDHRKLLLEKIAGM